MSRPISEPIASATTRSGLEASRPRSRDAVITFERSSCSSDPRLAEAPCPVWGSSAGAFRRAAPRVSGAVAPLGRTPGRGTGLRTVVCVSPAGATPGAEPVEAPTSLVVAGAGLVVEELPAVEELVVGPDVVLVVDAVVVVEDMVVVVVVAEVVVVVGGGPVVVVDVDVVVVSWPSAPVGPGAGSDRATATAIPAAANAAIACVEDLMPRARARRRGGCGMAAGGFPRGRPTPFRSKSDGDRTATQLGRGGASKRRSIRRPGPRPLHQ